MVKLGAILHARWKRCKRWKRRLRRFLRGKYVYTCLGRHLMKLLATESGRVNYRTAIYTCREHVEKQLRPYNYPYENRVLYQLANFAPVVRLLKCAADSAVNILNHIYDSSVKAEWQLVLQNERDKQMGIFKELLEDEDQMLIEMGDDDQQLEILTLILHGVENWGSELTLTELDVISAAYDKVATLSNLILVGLPTWFDISSERWDRAETAEIDGGEEMCLRTAALWSELNHPNIQTFFGACHVGKVPFAIHEKTSSLKERSFSWNHILDCANGLKYMQERGILHQELSIQTLHLSSVGGVLTGLNLVTSQQLENSQSLFTQDIIAFGFAVARLIHTEMYTSLMLSDSEDDSHQLRVALSHFPPSKPDFVHEDAWKLLVGICNRDPNERFTMEHFIHQLSLLARQERIGNQFDNEADGEVIDDLASHTFDGRSITKMLADAEELCLEHRDLKCVNQPIYDRLAEVYRQLQGFTTLPRRTVIEDFIVILRRFITARDSDTYSSRVATLCASRTIAGRNYSIHHDIDRFLLSTAGLVNTATVHTWQSGWQLASQQRHNAMQACLQNPVPFLNELKNDDEQRDAVASLQFEARMCGNTSSLQSIEEYDTIPDWFIPPHEIEFGPFLSEGSFAAVYKGTWNGANVVVKQVLTQLKSAEDRAQFRQEVDLWFSLSHDHLIKLYGACHVGRAAFVCEIATRGTLVSFAKNKERWEVWKCMYEASLGLLHLHERQIVHGDLKGNNILVCEKNVKLADFGLSFVANRPETSLGANGALGAFPWKAPECLNGEAPTFASDIYSFGMCIFEVLTGAPPWGTLGGGAVKHNVVKKRRLPARPEGMDNYDWYLISLMCAYDPDERITANAVTSFAYDQYQAVEYAYRNNYM